MTREQWALLRRCLEGGEADTVPVALIVDSPWIPGFLGLSTLDYLTVPDVWLEANLAVARRFPDVIFLPGYWAEIGMGAEPSAFGCRLTFFPDRTPVAHPLINGIEELDRLPVPDPRADGFLPILLNQLRRVRPAIADAGHVLKMVAARGPLTTASHLMGVTQFLLALKLEPAATHRLLALTADLTRRWLEAQAEAIGEAEGILVLDDLAGMMSAKDYVEFAQPYLQRVFDAFPGALKLFHNDTDNPVSYPLLRNLGIHGFNFTHLQPLAKVRAQVGPELCLLGNVPPLEVLAQGTPEQVRTAALDCLRQHPGRRGLILSAGGGTSPGTPAANIRALGEAARSHGAGSASAAAPSP
jgi:uroporphyrinogen decarboxylase